MAILGQIHPKRINLNVLIQESVVLDEKQKKELIDLALNLKKEELQPILNLLQSENNRLQTMKEEYHLLIEKYQQKIQEKEANQDDQEEVDDLMAQLNNV